MDKLYSVMGDSISTFRGIIPPENRWLYDDDDSYGTGVTSPDDTWWARVIADEGGKLLSNASFSGSMIEGWGFPAGSSKERARQLLGSDGSAPDVVLIYMGINDYGWGSEKAQAAGGSFASPANFDKDMRSIKECPDIDAPSGFPEAVPQVPSREYEGSHPDDLAPSDAVQRFKAAYVEMIANIRDVAPKAEIRCITLSPARIKDVDTAFCYSLRGVELDEYNDAIREAASTTGSKLIDVRSLGLDYDSKDGTHPTLEGMEQLAMLVEAASGDNGILDRYPSGMKSIRRAEGELKAGEEGAPVTDQGWKCVVEI